MGSAALAAKFELAVGSHPSEKARRLTAVEAAQIGGGTSGDRPELLHVLANHLFVLDRVEPSCADVARSIAESAMHARRQ